MELILQEPKKALKIRFIEGSVTSFTGEELRIGINGDKALPRRKLIIQMRRVVSLLKQHQVKVASLAWSEVRRIAERKISDLDLGTMMATAFVMAEYEHTTFKTPPKGGFPAIKTLAILGAPKLAQRGIERGIAIGQEVNGARELSNTPGGDMTPHKLAEEAIAAAEGTKVRVKVLGRAAMEELGMGAVVGIAKGSAEEPQFIVMEYWGAGRGTQKPIVLCGKGVTFDTGGLNVKPGDHMYEMHMDMSGGAAAIHAIVLAAKLGVKKNVVALIPAVENSPSGTSVRPGDILKSLSGKTIEVLNTDAEGRVILADAITYAKRYKPAAVVDIATLTGAAIIALGTVASAFMTNRENQITSILDMAERSGDYLWPLPMWDEYNDMTKGTFGDVPNISTMGNSRAGGVIAGGKFLEVFAKELECPWIHLDIAPRMTSYPGEFLAKGAAGAPVRFLLEYIEKSRAK